LGESLTSVQKAAFYCVAVVVFADELVGVATYDPSAECQAKREIALEKPKAPDGH